MRSSTLVKFITTLALAGAVSAHGEEHDPANGEATYAELHMAQEVRSALALKVAEMETGGLMHTFYLSARDGILDVNELESVYGVHHEKSKKASGGSTEVHTAKAQAIVKKVLELLDSNGDGVLTMREFIAGGVAGLPNFEGVEHLGHHYDAEGEYFLHHEEKFHNTPETQGENAYVHPEDIEHFMAHEDIERTEAERVLEFQGLASDGQPVDPNVNQAAFQAKSSDSASDIAAREAREAYALAQALKFGNDVREASKRGGYGETGFFRPKDTADRLRRGVPFKYRAKKGWGGEF